MLVLFATIRSPTFVLRAVMMPGNGAVTRLNATCCSRTRTLAAKASALALVVVLVGGCVVGVELGDDAFVPQLLPFVVRNFGQLRASLRERGLGTGLLKLMVKIRCVDLSQQLVLLNVCPDVYEPAFEVPVNPRKDTRFLPRSDLSWKHQSIGRRTSSWRNYRYGWYCQLIRIGGGLFTL